MARDFYFQSAYQVKIRMDGLSNQFNKDGPVVVSGRLLSETFAAIANLAEEIEKLQTQARVAPLIRPEKPTPPPSAQASR